MIHTYINQLSILLNVMSDNLDYYELLYMKISCIKFIK